MSQANYLTVASEDAAARGNAFYRCVDAVACGLRFPVSVSDSFRNRCPQCGGAVQLVATAGASLPNLDPQDGAVTTASSRSHIHLLLDNWRSLFNVGAAFRTADGAGLCHLYLCGITATPERQRKLAKTALGAERAVAWSYHADAVKTAAEMQQAGAQIWVLERNADSRNLFDITSWPQETTIMLVAGNEVVGVDPGLMAMADRVIHVPMAGSKQSLNVAVATSVASYWLRAQELAAQPIDQPGGVAARGD